MVDAEQKNETHISTKFERISWIFLYLYFFTMNEYVSQQSCSQKFCRNYGKNNGDSVAVHDKKHNRFRCRVCGKTWSAHSQEFHYGLRTELIKVRRVLDLLKVGIPIRTVAKFVKVGSSTVMRWKKKMKGSRHSF